MVEQGLTQAVPGWWVFTPAVSAALALIALFRPELALLVALIMSFAGQ